MNQPLQFSEARLCHLSEETLTGPGSQDRLQVGIKSQGCCGVVKYTKNKPDTIESLDAQIKGLCAVLPLYRFLCLLMLYNYPV